MPSTSNPNLNKSSSNVIDRLYATASASVLATEQGRHAKNTKDVIDIDSFMEDKTESKILKQGRKDMKGMVSFLSWAKSPPSKPTNRSR